MILFPSCCSEYSVQNTPSLVIGHTAPTTHDRMCHRSMYPPPDHLTLRKSVSGRDLAKPCKMRNTPTKGTETYQGATFRRVHATTGVTLSARGGRLSLLNHTAPVWAFKCITSDQRKPAHETSGYC
ncbi:unnamed protein product [Ectocarpus sp. 12 AP-2014]